MEFKADFTICVNRWTSILIMKIQMNDEAMFRPRVCQPCWSCFPWILQTTLCLIPAEKQIFHTRKGAADQVRSCYRCWKIASFTVFGFFPSEWCLQRRYRPLSLYGGISLGETFDRRSPFHWDATVIAFFHTNSCSIHSVSHPTNIQSTRSATVTATK